MNPAPERLRLSDRREISRALTGLWQVADIERQGPAIDTDTGAGWLADYVAIGQDSFDMADHYGSAEVIAGRLLARGGQPRPMVATRWRPPPGPMTAQVVRAGVQERLQLLGAARINLLQFQWWSFEHPAWLDAQHELARLRAEGLIAELGVANFDAAHFNLAPVGWRAASDQSGQLLVDRRARGGRTGAGLRATGAWILGHGTLNSGFLSQRWLGQPEPDLVSDWSKMKYNRFIRAAGGWQGDQQVLVAAAGVARKHLVSLSNVATRWVLKQARVAGVIIRARLGGRFHGADTLALFSFVLDGEDRATLEAAFAATPHPRRSRRRTPKAPVPDRLGRSVASSGCDPPAFTPQATAQGARVLRRSGSASGCWFRAQRLWPAARGRWHRGTRARRPSVSSTGSSPPWSRWVAGPRT